MFRSYSFNLRIIPKQQRDNKGVVLFLKHFNKHHKVIFFLRFQMLLGDMGKVFSIVCNIEIALNFCKINSDIPKSLS